MDLERLNNSYKNCKEKLKVKNETIEKLEKDLQTELDDIQINKAAIILAKRKNDESKIENEEKEIKEQQQKIKEIQSKIEIEKEEMQMFQERIDKIVEEIKEEPEMKEHIEQILAMRYDRGIKKSNKEIKDLQSKIEKAIKKEEEEDKKITSIETIEKIINSHRIIKNAIQGMLGANNAIKKLNEELAKLDIVKDKTRIEEIKKEIQAENTRLGKNRDTILTFSSKNKLGITKEILEAIMKNSIFDKKTGKIDINASLINKIGRAHV